MFIQIVEWGRRVGRPVIVYFKTMCVYHQQRACISAGSSVCLPFKQSKCKTKLL